jgi:tetratricopeptide (TPR) repeat protein
MVLSLVLLPLLLRAEEAPDIQPLTPYETALLDYKTGKYAEARAAIDAAEKEKPGDPAIELLKARILTEQGDFTAGRKLLQPLLTPAGPNEVLLALGDLFLRKHDFNDASKYYGLALERMPHDPDITLKLVYARIGVSDLIGAGEYASHLRPLDPNNPYDDHASYYFAKAALAQAIGKSQEADDDLQTARTIYGNTIANRYLKTYLEFFSSDKGPASDITPPPLLKNPPPK